MDVVGALWTGALALWCAAWLSFCLLALGYGRQARAARSSGQSLSLVGIVPHLHKLGLSEAWQGQPSGEASTLLHLNPELSAQLVAEPEPEPSFLDEMILVPGPTFMPLRPYETLLYADEIGQMGEAARRALLSRLSHEDDEAHPALRAS
ncbi:MAG: hypothetical protein NZ750_04230 [Anaerolineae bacterium]|nr:hypothetical protein [Anaerolineae bacterium]MDW8171529.1 hypothetical protein [Anaerolineae bacterium]